MDNGFVARLLKGLAASSLGSVVTVAFHFLSIMLLTRFVPQDVLGMYFLALAAVQVLKILSGLGLELTVTKMMASGDGSARKDAVASTIAVRLVCVAVVGLAFYATSRLLLPLFDARLNDQVVTIIVLFALAGFEELFLSLIQGVQQFKGYALVQIFSAAARVVLLIAYRDRLSLQGLLSIEIVSVLAAFLIQLFMTRRLLIGLSPRNINATSVRSVTRFSIPLYSNNILTIVYDRSSVFLIGALLNPASVAAYEVALKIPDGLMRLFRSFIVVYFPSLSSLFARGKRDDAGRMMNTSLVLLSAGITFLVLVAFLFADEIILALFPPEYKGVSITFALLMLNFYMRAISNILGYSLVAAGYSSAPVKANIVASVINVTASFVLIRAFGYIGAAYSLVLMNVTTQILYSLFLARAGLAPRHTEYLKPVILLGIAIAANQFFGSASILVKLVLVALYVAACWLLIDELRESTRSILKHALRSRAHKRALASSSEEA